MKEKRVLVLLRKGLEPPKTIEGLSDDEVVGAPWKTEYDVVVTLEELGHQVKVLSVYDELSELRGVIQEWKPHIAFNLLEEFAGEVLYDQNIVTYLELMGVPYTGCNPRGMIIARDKAISKKLLAYHRIRTPRFFFLRRGGRIHRPKKLEFPLFVKSAVEEASLGISQASLVKTDAALAERVKFIFESTGKDAMVEEFIEGRELYVGVLGNTRLQVFPVWELLFEKAPAEQPLIATARAKWSLKYQKKWGIISRQAKDLPEDMVEKIQKRCKQIYRILGMSGYARFDFRLDGEGRLFFLEANPNPQISYGEDFAESGQKVGISYEELIQRIISLGLRWKRG